MTTNKLTDASSPYVWLVCNDLSPNRATVIRICESGPEARALENESRGQLLIQPSSRSEGVKVGDRIWRAV
jgi:hypothetical protein